MTPSLVAGQPAVDVGCGRVSDPIEGAEMKLEDPWDEDDGQELEASIMQADHASGSESRGTTSAEALAGLSINDAVARERSGRRTIDEAVELVADGIPDEEKDLVADGAVEHDDFAAPEEAALSIRDTAPGATDHEDPNPVDGA